MTAAAARAVTLESLDCHTALDQSGLYIKIYISVKITIFKFFVLEFRLFHISIHAHFIPIECFDIIGIFPDL